jgi:MFS superfamily sulfate permease-like transporter
VFSRTAVNAASGARTPMGGVVTGMLVMLCLAVLMPYCAFIPKVMCADYKIQYGIWFKKQNVFILRIVLV